MNEIKDQEVCVQRIFLLLNDDVHDSARLDSGGTYVY